MHPDWAGRGVHKVRATLGGRPMTVSSRLGRDEKKPALSGLMMVSGALADYRLLTALTINCHRIDASWLCCRWFWGGRM